MTFDQLNPGQCAAALLLLAIGVALMLIAQRRDWRPSLALAISTALVLRVVMLALAWRTQPYDLSRMTSRPRAWTSCITRTPS